MVVHMTPEYNNTPRGTTAATTPPADDDDQQRLVRRCILICGGR